MWQKFKDRFDYLWTPAYDGSGLVTMWLCILLAIVCVAQLVLTIINK